MASSDVVMFILIEDASNLLSAVEWVISSHSNAPLALKGVEQLFVRACGRCARCEATAPLGRCLEVFLQSVNEADSGVPRSPHVIEQTHLLLQRTLKRMENMRGAWDDFTSWQAVQEVEQLKATKKQLKVFSRSLNLTCFGSPRSTSSSSTPSHHPSLGGASRSPVAPRTSHLSTVPPGHISHMHAAAAQTPSSHSGAGPPSGWIHSGINSCNSGIESLPERAASAALHDACNRRSSSHTLDHEASRSSVSAPLHAVAKHKVQNGEGALAVKQTFSQPTHAQRLQQAENGQRAQPAKRMPAAVREFLKPPASTGSCMSEMSEFQTKDQFEDPRSQHIAKAAIAEIGARMAAQEQGWPQLMHGEHSPRWAQREQDDVTAEPLCVLPSTYHAMTPPTSVSTVVAPHLPESSPDLPHHAYIGEGIYGDAARHMGGFIGGLNGPMPKPRPSPHYTPPKPPSIAAAQRYAAPRPPPPPHPPTTVGSATSDQSIGTCSTALAGAGTSAIVFTFADSQRGDASEPQSRNFPASAQFANPPAYTYEANSRDASSGSPGIILPQLPRAAFKSYCADSDTSSIAAVPGPVIPATAPVAAAAPAAAAAAAALAAAQAACAGGDSDAASIPGSAAEAAAAAGAAAAAAGSARRTALRAAPPRAPSLHSMPSLPSSVSSMWGQSAPRLCSSPRGAEEKYLFASQSTRSRNKQENHHHQHHHHRHQHQHRAYHRRSLPGPCIPKHASKTHAKPLMSCVAKIPASRHNAHHTISCLADSPVTEMVNSIDGTKVKVAAPVSYSAQAAKAKSLAHMQRRASEGCKNMSALAVDRAREADEALAAAAAAAAANRLGGIVEQRFSVSVSAGWSTGALRRPSDVRSVADSMKVEGESGTQGFEEMEYRGGVIDEEVRLDSGSTRSVYSPVAPGSAPARSGPLPQAAGGALAAGAGAGSAAERRCSTAPVQPPATPVAAAGAAAPAVLAGAAAAGAARSAAGSGACGATAPLRGASPAQRGPSSSGTASHSLPLADLKSPSDHLKCARLSYALPDGTMPSLAPARRKSKPTSSTNVEVTHPAAAEGAVCLEPSSDTVFFPPTATSYHPSSHGGMTFDASCIDATSATSNHPSRHEYPSSHVGPSSLENTKNNRSTRNSTEIHADEDRLLRSPPCAADALAVNSRTPTDSPETITTSNMHAVESHNDQELNIHATFPPQKPSMYPPETPLGSSSPADIGRKSGQNGKLAPAKTRPIPQSQRVKPASDAEYTKIAKGRPGGGKKGGGVKKMSHRPQFKVVGESDINLRSSEKVLQPRTSPESIPPVPSMQASTVSSGSKVAAYRYQPLPKSIQKKLPTPKQVTIAEHLSGKLAAAVSGESGSDTPSSVGSIAPENQKLRTQDMGTSCMLPSSHTTQTERDKAAKPSPPRCLVLTFFCGTCIRPPVVTEQ